LQRIIPVLFHLRMSDIVLGDNRKGVLMGVACMPESRQRTPPPCLTPVKVCTHKTILFCRIQGLCAHSRTCGWAATAEPTQAMNAAGTGFFANTFVRISQCIALPSRMPPAALTNQGRSIKIRRLAGCRANRIDNLVSRQPVCVCAASSVCWRYRVETG
jgi:hypothetical protein